MSVRTLRPNTAERAGVVDRCTEVTPAALGRARPLYLLPASAGVANCVTRVAAQRPQLKAPQVLAHTVAEAFTTGDRRAPGQHQDEVPARRTADLPDVIHVHQARPTDAQQG